MYCSSCGTTITPGLSYCNRCGASVAVKERSNKLSQMATENLLWAIVAMATLSIGAVIALIALMKNTLSLSDGLIVIIAFLSALPFLLAEILFIVMMLRTMSDSDPLRDRRLLNEPTAQELEGVQARSLSEPMMSVAEHTTRTLEAVPRKRPAE